MCKYIFVLLLLSKVLLAQLHHPANIQALKDYDNVNVQAIYSDSLGSMFVVWVKKSVPLHVHEHHTEYVQVISGKGRMMLGQEQFVVKKGDLIVIPKNTPHAVTKVYGRKPLKVISTQTPEFLGKDRVFISGIDKPSKRK